MKPSNLIRLGGLAAMLGGGLVLLTDLLGLVAIDLNNPSQEATTGAWAVYSGGALLGAVLLLLGLVAIYIPQSEAAGTFGLVGFVLAFAGTVLGSGVLFSDTFIAPSLAVVAPEFLEGGPTEVYGVFGFVLFASLFVLGWVLFGVATLRARVYPRWAAVLLIVGWVIAPLPVIVPLPELLIALVRYGAVMWLGFFLLSGKGREIQLPQSVR